MKIAKELESLIRKHPGATGEGLRIALDVVQKRSCATCSRWLADGDRTRGSCVLHEGGERFPDHFCDDWEERDDQP